MLKDIPFLDDALDVVRSHQERYDGTGYPQGLLGDTIPAGARVFAVADALDAITSDRPYRKARAYHVACGEILANRGTQFDPHVVDVFADVPPDRWEELREKVTRMPDLRVRTLVFGEEDAAGGQSEANGV
jgi:HD-GYP domain-containing protein (c-di-GMP phosphodiesterase class II)